MVWKFEPDVWYNIDLLIDWENQHVSIYVEDPTETDTDKQGR
jgi:hypothetical protein